MLMISLFAPPTTWWNSHWQQKPKCVTELFLLLMDSRNKANVWLWVVDCNKIPQHTWTGLCCRTPLRNNWVQQFNNSTPPHWMKICRDVTSNNWKHWILLCLWNSSLKPDRFLTVSLSCWLHVVWLVEAKSWSHCMIYVWCQFSSTLLFCVTLKIQM